jgi:hypothetical protein
MYILQLENLLNLFNGYYINITFVHIQMECGICIEKYNKSNRLPIVCSYCEYSACRKCCETWLLNETNARCLNSQCGKEWTRQFVASTFTKSFMCNDYKKHRETILFDQERALLPATQPLVENILQRERIDLEIRRIESEELSVIQRRISVLRAEYNRLVRTNTNTVERSTFIKACPDGECRGFLSSQWKCGLCEKWACSDCHEIKGFTRDCEHVCDPNTVATAALLANDTKSCPNCGTGIHKLDGCDQMFCTMCNTGFSWRTGRVETNIHNPHYFEYLRRTGGDEIQRNPNEIRCGQEINNTFVRSLMSCLRARVVPADITTRVSRICEAIIHHRYVDMENYQVNRVLNNQDLRIQYMRNKISEDDFKTQIQRLDKKHQKNREIYHVLAMLNTTVTDILYRFDEAIRSDTFSGGSLEERQRTYDILKEIDRIREYVNECLADIAKTYGSKPLEITETVRLR